MGDLLHAWREWLAGHDTAQLPVFGVPVLCWGRLGKRRRSSAGRPW
ncbi:hypothetical protein [Amycolatopsis sp. NPDC051903]